METIGVIPDGPALRVRPFSSAKDETQGYDLGPAVDFQSKAFYMSTNLLMTPIALRDSVHRVCSPEWGRRRH